MDRLSKLPFLLHFVLALFSMPLDIFAFNQRNVGTAKVSPWQGRLSAMVARVANVWARLMAFLCSPRAFQASLAVLVLGLALTHHVHPLAAVIVPGLTDPKEIREKINKLGADMRDITVKCKTDSREMTADEERSFDQMDTDREKLIEQERRLIRVEEIEKGEGRRAEPRQPGHEADETRQERKVLPTDGIEAVRAWMQSGTEKPLSAKQFEAAKRVGVNPAAKTINLRLAGQAMRSISVSGQDEWEKRALSTLTGTSPEDGSYLIANEMLQPLERALLAFGGMRQASTIRRTNTGANYPIPTNDDTSNKGYLLSENTQTVKKDVAFGQLVLNAFKFSSKEILVSLELMQDSNEDLASFLGAALGERIGRITNDYFTTGTGSSEPKGIVTASTASGVQLAAQTPTYAELVSAQHSVDPAYRVGGAWMFSDSMLAEIKKIVDASTGRPIWLPNMIQGEPDSILGDPYFINQSMAAAAGSGAGKSILYGALSKYIIRDVRDITLFRLDELYAEYFQVAFIAFSRHDGDLLDAGTHPVKHVLNKA